MKKFGKRKESNMEQKSNSDFSIIEKESDNAGISIEYIEAYKEFSK